jgi:hypothetical protein
VEFKEALRANQPKFGCFVNSASPTVAEQVPLAFITVMRS